tara:strand:- start:1486 stop:1926 length:441 start_codon:yes stop_codon:yes gene_type:complete
LLGNPNIDTMVEINSRIRKLREQLHYSQESVADFLDISQSAYCQLESGKTKLSYNHLINIAKSLEIDLNILLSNDPIIFKDYINNLTQLRKKTAIKILKKEEALKEEIILLKSQMRHVTIELENLKEELKSIKKLCSTYKCNTSIF